MFAAYNLLYPVQLTFFYGYTYFYSTYIINGGFHIVFPVEWLYLVDENLCAVGVAKVKIYIGKVDFAQAYVVDVLIAAIVFY